MHTIDQFKKDLLLVAQNACDLVVSLTPQGDGNIVIILENICSNFTSIKSNLDKCEKDTKDIQSLSDSDAESVLVIIKGIVPNIAKASELVVQKKDAIAQLPSTEGGTTISLIKTQIDGLRTRVLVLANIMIQLSPPKYKEEITSIKVQIDALFQQALNAYSSQ